MKNLVKAEFRRLTATRLWLGALLAATVFGGGMVGLLALVGPENFYYLYMGEMILMAIPGVNALYPVLPGGATASLTGFTYVADARWPNRRPPAPSRFSRRSAAAHCSPAIR